MSRRIHVDRMMPLQSRGDYLSKDRPCAGVPAEVSDIQPRGDVLDASLERLKRRFTTTDPM